LAGPDYSGFQEVPVHNNKRWANKRWTNGWAAALGLLWLLAGTVDAGEFKGKIGRTYADSVPSWPEPPRAPKGAPNIVVLMLDDAGFATLGSYGSPIATPNIDRLAAGGLRYTDFHSTGMCSPSRAALLSGRNPHSVGFGAVGEMAAGYPGYNNQWPKSAASLARVLRDSGYNTAALGKWHNTPLREISVAGPFDSFPSSLGFEYFYGFFGGDTNNWTPSLWLNTAQVETPRTPGYHLTTDLADHAIRWLGAQRSAAPDKPFFLYFAPVAVHAPHQAPQSFIDRYHGKFDQGWDAYREQALAQQKKLGIAPADAKLAASTPSVPRWSELPEAQRHAYARMMEVFAAFMEHTDFEFGRVLQTLAATGQLDNTLVLVMADNGASHEGGVDGTFAEGYHVNLPDPSAANLEHLEHWGSPQTYPHYPIGWAQAANTPFSYFKQSVHDGGTRGPLIAHWPQRIKDAGAVRTQYHHLVDIMPTVLELIGIEAPKAVDGIDQQPIEGISMAYSFDQPKAATRKRVQKYEMLGNRGLWQDGWFAVTYRGKVPIVLGEQRPPFDQDRWELYRDDDFSRSQNIAERHPERVEALQERWWREAETHQVLPLDDRIVERFAELQRHFNTGRKTFTFYPGAARLPRDLSPFTINRSHRIDVAIDSFDSAAAGVLIANGGRFGGYSLFVKDGHLHYAHNLTGVQREAVVSQQPIPAGAQSLRMDFIKTGDRRGRVVLYADDREIGAGAIEHGSPAVYSLMENLDIGRDEGTPVSEEYEAPADFSGRLQKVEVSLQ
jgi:arylsulfatase